MLFEWYKKHLLKNVFEKNQQESKKIKRNLQKQADGKQLTNRTKIDLETMRNHSKKYLLNDKIFVILSCLRNGCLTNNGSNIFTFRNVNK